MNLVVVSSCAHVFHEGKWCSFEPFILEMNAIAEIFDKLILLVPTQVAPELPPFWAPYIHQDKLQVFSYKNDEGRGLNSGANSKTALGDILFLLKLLMKHVNRRSALHVRSPSGISIPALLVARLLTKYRFAKYAGQWNAIPDDRLAIRLQKSLLKSRWWGSPVTVYGNWPDQPQHIVSFFTSMMTREMLDTAKSVARNKNLGDHVNILFSGRLAPEKRVVEVLGGCKLLWEQGIDFRLRILGDGSERASLEKLTRDYGLEDRVAFIGHLPFAVALRQNDWADILVLPSNHSEGWPKAVAEAMSHGVVCLAVDHGQLHEMLQGRGVLMPKGDASEISSAIVSLMADPALYRRLSCEAASWAQQYSLDGLKAALETLLQKTWGVGLRSPTLGGATNGDT